MIQSCLVLVNCFIAAAMLVKVHSNVMNRKLKIWDENESACLKILPEHITTSFLLWVMILLANAALIEILIPGILDEATESDQDIRTRLMALIIARVSTFYSIVIFDLFTGKLSNCIETLTCRSRLKAEPQNNPEPPQSDRPSMAALHLQSPAPMLYGQ